MESVTDIVNLRYIRGDQNNPRSGLQQLREKFVNFDFRTDVDAHRWFVENKKAGPMVQPFSDHDFLLISAGEARRGCVARSSLDLDIPNLLISSRFFGKRVND